VLEDLEDEPATDELLAGEPEVGSADNPQTAQKVIIDTDPGVDDAAALVWLLTQSKYPIDPLALVTVMGNGTITHTTKNAQFVLSLVGKETIPVVRGADRPTNFPTVRLTSTTKLIHGPDGLWFTAAAFKPSTQPLDNAAQFYCMTLQGHESEILLLTLGPLTNVANAILDPACQANATEGKGSVDWSKVRIVSLGGAFSGGNQTPTAEFNLWQDPEAAQTVLDSGAQVSLVLLDAFDQFVLQPGDLLWLQWFGVPAIKTLLPAVLAYSTVQAVAGGTAALPDPVAAIYALDAALGAAQSALVQVVGSNGAPENVRGQTVIGFDFSARLSLSMSDTAVSKVIDQELASANPGTVKDVFSLAFTQIFPKLGSQIKPDNASAVTDIHAKRMRLVFLAGLTAPLGGVHKSEAAFLADLEAAAAEPEMTGQLDNPVHQLYLPALPGD
jgi:inosine-uridine nucleoside N-ribohydrolase